jgi:predicted nuclease of predicted toxin-antitoxin system
MKFLLDANMPRSAASLLRKLGHEVEDVRDVLPDGADDAAVAAHAQARQRILITRDFDFADIRNYPPANYAGIIVLELPDDAIASQVNQALHSFVGKPELLARLTGRLAIVELWRVRFRPHEPTT